MSVDDQTQTVAIFEPIEAQKTVSRFVVRTERYLKIKNYNCKKILVLKNWTMSTNSIFVSIQITIVFRIFFYYFNATVNILLFITKKKHFCNNVYFLVNARSLYPVLVS